MKAIEKESLIARIEAAEIFFKLGFGLSHAFYDDKATLIYPDVFSYGKHIVTRDEWELTEKELEQAGPILEHVSTYLTVVQIDTVLGKIIEERFEHPNADIRSACWIARLIRNAFSHDPFHPTWILHPECENKQYHVPQVIELNTTGLHRKPVRRMDYGGPLSILRLLQWTKGILSAP